MTLLAALMALTALPALAQQTAAGDMGSERPWSLGLAVGHGQRSNPFVASDDMDVNAVLDIAWYGERFFFDNGDFGFNLQEQARWTVDALLTFNNERNYFSYLSNGTSGLDIGSLRSLASSVGVSSVGPAADGELEKLSVEEMETLVFAGQDSDLPERDFAANAGLELLSINAWGDVQLQVLTDVSSTHNGQSAWLSWSYPWLTQSTEYSLTVGAEWKSADLVKYYYGVRPEESLNGRDVYEGGSATNTVVRFSATHELSQHWQIVGVLEREFLGDTISASPIIKDNKIDTFFIGLYYGF